MTEQTGERTATFDLRGEIEEALIRAKEDAVANQNFDAGCHWRDVLDEFRRHCLVVTTFPAQPAAAEASGRELPSPWRKPIPDQLFQDGDQYLVAVPLLREAGNPAAGHYYEYSVIAAHCDSETPVSFDCNGASWGWGWDDVEAYVPLSEFKLKPLPAEPAEQPVPTSDKNCVTPPTETREDASHGEILDQTKQTEAVDGPQGISSAQGGGRCAGPAIPRVDDGTSGVRPQAAGAERLHRPDECEPAAVQAVPSGELRAIARPAEPAAAASGEAERDYPTAARTIHLWLKEFCDERLAFPAMIADAARKASLMLDCVRADNRQATARAESTAARLAEVEADLASSKSDRDKLALELSRMRAELARLREALRDVCDESDSEEAAFRYARKLLALQPSPTSPSTSE